MNINETGIYFLYQICISLIYFQSLVIFFLFWTNYKTTFLKKPFSKNYKNPQTLFLFIFSLLPYKITQGTIFNLNLDHAKGLKLVYIFSFFSTSSNSIISIIFPITYYIIKLILYTNNRNKYFILIKR